MKHFCIFLMLSLSGFMAFAQTSEIKGRVHDDQDQPLPYVVILAYQGDIFVNGVRTDEEGKYSIPLLPPGLYRVKARYLDWEQDIEDVPLTLSSPRYLDFKFQDPLDCGVTIPLPDPTLFTLEAVPSGLTFQADEIRRIAH